MSVEQPPADVLAWVEETYTPEGVAVWLDAWREASPDVRARYERIARTPSGGT